MISAKRIVEIFRSRGGGEEFINLAGRLPSKELAYLSILAGDEPLVSKLSPENEWLVLTRSHLVIEKNGMVIRVPYGDLYAVNIPRQDLLNPRIKDDGGDLEVGLRDGASLQIRLQPGGPYLGLMNVLMRIARINRRKPKYCRVVKTNSQRQTTSD